MWRIFYGLMNSLPGQMDLHYDDIKSGFQKFSLKSSFSLPPGFTDDMIWGEGEGGCIRNALLWGLCGHHVVILWYFSIGG